ncbi:MAG: energy-coupling factor transporter transmembrane protein EcfT [Anaerolineales bacterium]|nr:MAG: energy-coupling factor transporter transmembrane protein EcfT [Anaerolineales bacterium]
MAEVFGLYKQRASFIHGLHPLTKLAVSGFFLLAGLSLPGMWSTYLLVIFGLLPLAFLSRLLLELVSRTGRIVLPFMISVFLIQGILWSGGTPLIEVGPISFKQEGVQFAIASSGRILIVVGSFLWFALTTRPDQLMLALAERGLPSSLSYLIVSSIQIVPRFQARANTILDAQRSRGLEIAGSIFQRARAVLPLVAPLILSSLIDVEERALAIEVRGFNYPGPKTSYREIAQAAWEPMLQRFLLLAMAGTLILSIVLRLVS